ncbi:MAG: WG repeat-containing protein, partial [bacterium]
ILSLIILTVSIAGIFVTYFYTGPQQLKYGYIDAEGNKIVKPEYKSVNQFKGDLARFKKNGRHGLLDQQGNIVFKPEFTSINQQNSHLVVGLVDANLKIMKRGGKLLEDNFLKVGDITSSPVRVKTDEGWGLLDKAGNYLVEPKFDSLEPFSDKKHTIAKINDRVGLINQEGDILLEASYDNLKHISENLYWITKDGKHGLADGGNILIEPRYDNRKPFSEGLAAVRLEKKWGFINKQGEEIVEPEFEDVGAFSNGRAQIGVVK